MIKKTYCYTYQSWFCHCGARPSIHEFDSREEAVKHQSLAYYYCDDGYVGNVYEKRTVILTDDDIAKQNMRKASRVIKPEEHKWNAIYHFWDGHTEVCRCDEREHLITFASDGVVWPYDRMGPHETISLFSDDRKTKVVLAYEPRWLEIDGEYIQSLY